MQIEGGSAGPEESMSLDKRLHAYRDDLAEIALEGRVAAARFTEGERGRITAAVAPLRRQARPGAPLDTELLFGEDVTVLDRADGWAWIKSSRDGYVGYVPSSAVGPEGPPVTHRMAALRGFVFPRPDLKAPPVMTVHLESRLSIIGESGRYSELAGGGYIYSDYLRPIDQVESDPIAVALTFMHAPYLWGGRSSLGLDCSALVQLSWQACGIDCPRDTDMQFDRFGTLLNYDGDENSLRRGDLVFWKGHIGIWIDQHRFLHSNASDMKVAMAPLSVTADRIESKGEGPITGIRRPPMPAKAGAAA